MTDLRKLLDEAKRDDPYVMSCDRDGRFVRTIYCRSKATIALEDRAPQLAEALLVAMDGLAFYEDETSYETHYERLPCDCCTGIFEPINEDKGARAKAALAAVSKIMGE